MPERTLSAQLREAVCPHDPLDAAAAWSKGRRARALRRAASVLALTGLIAAGTILAVTDRPKDAPVVSEVDTKTPSLWSGRGDWVKIADGPNPKRSTHVVAWTGQEIIVWGGATDSRPPDPDQHDYPPNYPGYSGNPRTDGARFDPMTGQWRPIPDAPVPFLGFDVSAVWTGTELLVWGVDSGRLGPQVLSFGALYNPRTDTWRRMADQSTIRHGRGVWTGSELLVIGGDAPRVAAYRPETNTWRPLSPPPVHNLANSMTTFDPVLTDRGLLFGIPWDSASPLFYDPATDAWTSAAPSPLGARAQTNGAWTGDVFVEVGRGLTNSDMVIANEGYGRYNPQKDEWSAMARPPDDLRRQTGGPPPLRGGHAIDHHALFAAAESTGPLPAYDGINDRWHTLPAPPEVGTLLWTGRDLWNLVKGGALYRYVPSAPGGGAPQPRR